MCSTCSIMWFIGPRDLEKQIKFPQAGCCKVKALRDLLASEVAEDGSTDSTASAIGRYSFITRTRQRHYCSQRNQTTAFRAGLGRHAATVLIFTFYTFSLQNLIFQTTQANSSFLTAHSLVQLMKIQPRVTLM